MKPNRRYVDVLTYGLICAAFAFGFVGGTLRHSLIVKKNVEVPQVIKTGKQAAAALGKPDAVYRGKEISAALDGTECGVWRSKAAVVCYVP